MIASCAGLHSVWLWNTTTGKRWEKFTLVGPRGIHSVAFSRDSKILALAAGGEHVRLEHIKAEPRWAEHIALPTAARALTVAYSPDGKWLAIGCLDGTIRLWNVALRSFQRTLKGHTSGVNILVFSPDSTTLASESGAVQFTKTSENASIRLWSMTTGNELHKFEGPSARHTKSLAFCNGGKTLASAGWDETVRLWDLTKGKVLRVLPGKALSVAASPDGKMLVLGERSGAARLWDLGKGAEVLRIAEAGRSILSVAFSPTGKTFAAAGGYDHSIGLWHVSTGKSVHPNLGHRQSVLDIRFSPDGKVLASRGGDHAVCLWGVRTGKEMRRLSLDPERRGGGGKDANVHSLAFAPNSKTLATLSSGGDKVQLWNLPGSVPHRQFSLPIPSPGGAVPFYSLALSPDGRTIAACGWGGIHIWATATGQVLRLLNAAPPGAPARERARELVLVFSPDGRTLISGDRGNRIRFWDWATGEQLRLIEEKDNWARCLVLSPDGGTLASCRGFLGAGRAPIRLWDVATGTLLHELKGHKESPYCVAFSPDGKTLASCGWQDKTVRLWDLFTGEELAKFEGHEGNVLCVAFAPDGRTLATGSDDTTILLWDVTRLVPKEREKRLTAAQLAACWADLAKEEPRPGYAALWALRQARSQAPSYLKARVRPVPVPDSAQVRRLISGLDADDSDTREAAEKGLAALAEVVEVDLRKALASKPSAEAKRRLERLLKAARSITATDQQLRSLRAVRVLEGIDSAEAREVLKTLARGAPTARLTREAHLALDRLGRRPAGAR